MTTPAWHRTFIVATAAIVVAAGGYGLCDWAGWTRLNLEPYSGDWSWQHGATQRVPINYYGNLLWAVGGGAIGATIGYAATVRRPALTASWLRLASAWALTAFAITGTYFWWRLWPL